MAIDPLPTASVTNSLGGCKCTARARHIVRRGSGGRNGGRRGVTTLELILVLPVMLIGLLGIMEFGLLLGDLKQLALASRVGAKLAAEQPAFDVEALKTAVDRELAAAGIPGPSQRVILQHNVGGGGTLVSSGSGTFVPPAIPPLPNSTDIPAGAVRVTVYLEQTQLAPDLLAPFGLSLAGQFVERTTTFPYEH